MATILCVDDDTYLTDLLCYALSQAGFTTLTAHSGHEALRLARGASVSLILLDVGLPDMDGLAVLAALRAVSRAPVVLLSARMEHAQIVAGFEHGADDYVAKPFSMQVLISRLQAVLRRAQPHLEALPPPTPAPTPPPARRNTFRLGRASFDADLHEISDHPMRVRLTPTENCILQLLLAHEGQVLPSDRIRDRIWGETGLGCSTALKTHIRHLREKLDFLPDGARIIQTVPSIGYVARPPRVDETAAQARHAG